LKIDVVAGKTHGAKKYVFVPGGSGGGKETEMVSVNKRRGKGSRHGGDQCHRPILGVGVSNARDWWQEMKTKSNGCLP